MKIEIKNFGPIKEFCFDLSKDLNIIFGQNNIGKSYCITVIYLLLKNLIEYNRSSLFLERNYIFYDNNEIVNKSRAMQRSIRAENKKISELEYIEGHEVELTEQVEDLLKKHLQNFLLPSLEKSFENSFSSISILNNKLSRKKFSLKVEFKDFWFRITPNKEKGLSIKNIHYRNKIKVQFSEINNSKYEKNSIIYIINPKNEKKTINIFSRVLQRILSYSMEELDSLVNNMYYFPASRSGLYQALSSFGSVIAELSKSRYSLTNKIELPNISEPVADYYLTLSNTNNYLNTENLKNHYFRIAQVIESNILQGEIRYNNDAHKIVYYSDKIDSEFDLSSTSSMISEIAPIVAYLKFIISDKKQIKNFSFHSRNKLAHNLIFIEEPEAHLHPEVQVKIMEIFSMLVNCNVKIIMTTHSNYMYNKLTNLILDKKIIHNRVGSYLLKMTENGSILDEKSMKANKDGIADGNFIDVAENLYEERLRIYGD